MAVNQSIKNWRQTTLGEMAEVVKDSWKVGDATEKYIGLEHIDAGTLSLNSVGNSLDLASNKFRFQAGDILFGKLRPYFRKVVIPRFTGVCSTDIWVIRAKKDYDQNFLFYFMANQVLIDKSMGASKGSHMPRADWNFLSQTVWEVPLLDEQRSIAAVLSSLDDKIELLRAQNKTLEEMAQRLFKEWFVDFNFPNEDGKPYKKSGGRMVESEMGEIPDGWRVGRLGDILELAYGKALKAENRSGSGFPVIGSGGVVGHDANFLVSGPGIVVGRKGTMGSVNWIRKNFTPIDTTFYVKDRLNLSSLIYHLFLLQSIDFKKIGSDSAVPGLNRESAYSVQIIIPPIEEIEEFIKIVFHLQTKRDGGEAQASYLSVLRDKLLPKLMSGEV